MNAPIFFKSAAHRERFLQAIQQAGKVYGGKIDTEYGAAYYILTSEGGMWERASDYIDREGLRSLSPSEEDPVPAPSLAAQGNMAIATFRQPARNLLVGPPEIDNANPHKTKICLPVETRGNSLQVCQIGGQFVIINGVHRAAAFLEVGRDFIPCLLRTAKSLYDNVFRPGSPGLVHEPHTLQYPPYICNLFDPAVAPRFQQIQTDQQLQLVFQHNVGFIPRDLQTP